MKPDERSPIDEILARAAAGGASSDAGKEAQIFAAIAEGTLRFDEISEDDFGAVVRAFGRDAVNRAFIEASGGALPSESMGPPKVREWPKPIKRRAAVWVAAAALVLAAAGAWFAVNRREVPAKPALLAIQFPSSPAASPAISELYPLGLPIPPLSKGPNYRSTGGTAGSGDEVSLGGRTTWRLKTVIVQTKYGWGSGAFISSDGFLLTNYHVVAEAVQEAALSGKRPLAQVLMARVVAHQFDHTGPIPADVYRVDAVHDLALVKLHSLPSGFKAASYFEFADSVRSREACAAIGSKAGGLPWAIDECHVEAIFQYPQQLTQYVTGFDKAEDSRDRNRMEVVQTNALIAHGDSGGPLLNAKGKLIGLTFATPAGYKGNIGWHIAVRDLQNFRGELPKEPEPAPFDFWTAGLPDTAISRGELSDADHDGRIDSLRFRYYNTSGTAVLTALAVYLDFAQHIPAPGGSPGEALPFGLWGLGDRGKFHFDLALLARKDGDLAAAYTDSNGVVSEIRLGKNGNTQSNLVWKRDSKGHWESSHPGQDVPLIDAQRIGSANFARISILAPEMLPREQ